MMAGFSGAGLSGVCQASAISLASWSSADCFDVVGMCVLLIRAFGVWASEPFAIALVKVTELPTTSVIFQKSRI
jgi:hypothetical protein